MMNRQSFGQNFVMAGTLALLVALANVVAAPALAQQPAGNAESTGRVDPAKAAAVKAAEEAVKAAEARVAELEKPLSLVVGVRLVAQTTGADEPTAMASGRFVATLTGSLKVVQFDMQSSEDALENISDDTTPAMLAGMFPDARFILLGRVQTRLDPAGRLWIAQVGYDLRTIDLRKDGEVAWGQTVDVVPNVTGVARQPEDAAARALEQITEPLGTDINTKLDAYITATRQAAAGQLEKARKDLKAAREAAKPVVDNNNGNNGNGGNGGNGNGNNGNGNGNGEGVGPGPVPGPFVPPTQAEAIGIGIDAFLGFEFLQGHNKSDTLFQMPNNLRKYVTAANGAATFNAFIGYDLTQLTKVPQLWIGIEGTIGAGDHVHSWAVAFDVRKKFTVGPVRVDFTLGVGAMQLNAGGLDIADVTFFQLTEANTNRTISISDAQARTDSTKRIESPVFIYVLLAGRVSYFIEPDTFEVFFRLDLRIGDTSSKFTQAGRNWNDGSSGLTVPGFEWKTFGLNLAIGTSVYF